MEPAQPRAEGTAANRLSEHNAQVKGLAAPSARGREQLEDVVGDELARRLVGALAGDHAIPARLFD